MTDLFADLQWRGLIHQTTDDDEISKRLNTGSVTVYAGFDPTADSLHVGSLMPLLYLRRFQKAGHRPIALVGGATGMIGDPSGRSDERNLLSADVLAANLAGIEAQMRRFLDFEGEQGALLVNNFDWMKKMSYLDFLRDIGKHAPVNVMKAKDSVKNRLESDAGISYTEFSYMLLQAYDFVHLNQEHNCDLQLGGSDQWGNITAGIDLARRMHSVQLYGMTCPLLTTKSGTKMGKTADGAIWLSPEKTSPYKFYQYWINVEDEDAGKCLRFLTELSQEEITELDAQRESEPGRRASQIRLAEELTRLVHGEEGLTAAEQAKTILHGGEVNADNLHAILDIVPSTTVPRSKLDAGEFTMIEALVTGGLAKSNGEARRNIKQGGAYVNNVRWVDADDALSPDVLTSETIMVLRSGKKKYALLRFE